MKTVLLIRRKVKNSRKLLINKQSNEVNSTQHNNKFHNFAASATQNHRNLLQTLVAIMRRIIVFIIIGMIYILDCSAQWYYFPFDLQNYSGDKELRAAYKLNHIEKVTVYYYSNSKNCSDLICSNCPTVSNCRIGQIVNYDKNGFENEVPINKNTSQFFKYSTDSLPIRIFTVRKLDTYLMIANYKKLAPQNL